MLATLLPSRLLRSNKGIPLLLPRVKINTHVNGFYICVLLEQRPTIPLSHFSYYLQETSEDTSLWLGISPLDTSTPDSLLIPWNCFIDFAIEDWFGCCTTEPGFAEDIGAIEIRFNQSINQTSIPPISPASQAQWCNSQISIQQQNRGNSSVTSTGHGEWRYLWGKGQVEEMCLQIFLEGSNWTAWTDRQHQVVPKRRGTRVKSSSTSIGLDSRDWQTIFIVWSQWTGRNRCSQHGMKINRLFSRGDL